MPVNKSHIVDAAIVAALLLVAAGGYYFSPLLLPKADVTAAADPGCSLHERACGAAVPGGGRIELSMAPRPIPNVQPLTAEVTLAGLTANKVVLDLAGAKMNMGVNRVELAPVAPGRFAGTSSLPVCVTGSMDWIATVMVETGTQRISVPFRFTSSPH
ncbi:MAG TPA: hypothetical protein VF801_00565 [Rhodocyclaceae bacterium]